MALRDMFTTSAISAASSHPLTGVSTFQPKRILLSGSVRVLTGPENSATVVLSCAVLRKIVVVHIGLLTVFYICTGVLNALAADMILILLAGNARRGVVLAG